MTWRFPVNEPFDLATLHGDIHNCAFVTVADGVLTVDRDVYGPLGKRYRLRSQVALEAIVGVHHYPPVQPEHAGVSVGQQHATPPVG